MKTKTTLIILLLAAWLSPMVSASVKPTPVIVSVAMREGTTYMDINYRVDDPDSATANVRILAFENGTASFADVIRPVTFVEGTETKIGDGIATNTVHTLTWDVGADWLVDLGQISIRILAKDDRDLLTIPDDFARITAHGTAPMLVLPEIKVSKTPIDDEEIMKAYFWLYASGDNKLTLENGVITASDFAQVPLVNGSAISSHAGAYILKRMDRDPSSYAGLAKAHPETGVAGDGWFVSDQTYDGTKLAVGWGGNNQGKATPPAGLTDVVEVVGGGEHGLALKSDGTVAGWGNNNNGQATPPAGLTDVVAIAAGGNSDGFNLALKADGTVVAWGQNDYGQATPPLGLAGVTAIAAGRQHSLALKSDGTVVGWGRNTHGQTTIPAGLTGVTAIAAGDNDQGFSLALKSDGTVVGWGSNNNGQTTIPAGLTNVVAIAASQNYSAALKDDGTVVSWGRSGGPPAGLTDVTAIEVGPYHGFAFKSDGTIVGWGGNLNGQATVPAGLTGVKAIAAGQGFSIAIVEDQPSAP
ncbi:MAG: RCC1 domain-containing protein [Luteolibacter sp.]